MGEPHASPTTLYTNYVTVSASTGQSPFTYSWAKVWGDAITCSNSSSNYVRFSGSVGPGTALTALFRCTVTDTAGIAFVVNVNVVVENTY